MNKVGTDFRGLINSKNPLRSAESAFIRVPFSTFQPASKLLVQQNGLAESEFLQARQLRFGIADDQQDHFIAIQIFLR